MDMCKLPVPAAQIINCLAFFVLYMSLIKLGTSKQAQGIFCILNIVAARSLRSLRSNIIRI